MKTNEIRIIINTPRKKVFEFTVEPKNTHLWIESSGEKTIDTKQIGLGTKYSSSYGVLEVTDYEKDVFFELTDEVKGYQCSYSYRKIDDTSTELVYFEAMFDGSDISDPLEVRYFEQLKEILEK